MQRTPNGSAAAPAIGGRIGYFEFALQEAADHLDFLAHVGDRDLGAGRRHSVRVVQRPVPWESAAAVSRVPAVSSAPANVVNLSWIAPRAGRGARDGLGIVAQ
jgi:hypothetical protein